MVIQPMYPLLQVLRVLTVSNRLQGDTGQEWMNGWMDGWMDGNKKVTPPAEHISIGKGLTKRGVHCYRTCKYIKSTLSVLHTLTVSQQNILYSDHVRTYMT